MYSPTRSAVHPLLLGLDAMLLLIDNYDSFTYNLVHYLGELGADVRVWRNDALDVQQELLKKGVIVRPCDSYDLGDCLRVTVGTPEQDARFIDTLEAALETVGARAPRPPVPVEQS